MKQAIIIAMLILCALPFTFGLNTIIGQGPSLQTTLLRYDPVPAEPGDVLDVSILVTNNGGSAAHDVKVEAFDNNPFSNDNPTDAIKSIPTLPGQESFLVKFKARVASDAAEGTAYFKIRTTSTDTGNQDALLAIPIKVNNPVISVDKIVVTPSTVRPGGTAKIDITLNNLANSRLKDISVSLSTTSTLGTTTTALPFAPIGESLDRRISALKPEEQATVSYDIITEPGAASNLYRVPLTITFSDESGTTHTLNDQVGLIINAEPSLEVYLETVSIYSDKTQGDITIKFVNNGLAQVKLLTAILSPSNDYDLLSQSREVYIGNINSDDYETATFTIKAKKNDLAIPVAVTYLDSFNNPQKKEVTLQATLVSQKSAGNGKSNSTGTIIIAIAVIALAFIGYRLIRRRKKR